MKNPLLSCDQDVGGFAKIVHLRTLQNALGRDCFSETGDKCLLERVLVRRILREAQHKILGVQPKDMINHGSFLHCVSPKN
jgi:hypothetical protein